MIDFQRKFWKKTLSLYCFAILRNRVESKNSTQTNHKEQIMAKKKKKAAKKKAAPKRRKAAPKKKKAAKKKAKKRKR